MIDYIVCPLQVWHSPSIFPVQALPRLNAWRVLNFSAQHAWRLNRLFTYSHFSPRFLNERGLKIDQKTFFHQAGVSINTSRFIVNGQIIPMADISSAQLHIIKPKHGLDVLFMLVGLLLLLDEGSLFVVGGLLCLIGIVLWLSAKESYAILLTIASDQRQIMQSSDRLFINQLMQALDDALQHHGEFTPGKAYHRDHTALAVATSPERLVTK